MSFTGKRSERIRIPRQVNFDAEMCGEIKARAARHNRPIGSEMVHLIMCGLLNDPDEAVHEQSGTSAHTDSRANAQPLTVTHLHSQGRAS